MAQHLQSVLPGQAQVQQHHVIAMAATRAGAQGRIGLQAVTDPVHRMALSAQQGLHGLADHGVIFDKQ